MEIRKREAYFRVIWKKGLLLLPRFLIAVVCITGVLGGAVYGFYKYVEKDQIMPRTRVGLVTAPGDVKTSVGAAAIMNMDSVKEVADIQFMDEETAENNMRTGKIDAAIYLTNNMFDDITLGTNTPVRVQITSKALVGKDLFTDLLESAVTLLQTGEAAVYALEAEANTKEILVDEEEMKDSLAWDFVGLGLNRSMVWNSSLLSPFGDITAADFYVMTVILVISCVFLGMGFGGLYDRRSRTVEQCIRRTGIGPVTSAAARVSVITAVLWALTAACCWGVGTFTELSTFHPAQLLYLPVLSFGMAGLIHLVHSWVSGSQGTMFYLLITILMFVAGGGIFPAAYLPGIVKNAVNVLPVHLWQQYLSEILWGSVSGKTAAAVLLSGLILTVLGSIGSERAVR